MNTANFNEYDEQTYSKFTNPSIIHRDLETLAGIITGIAADGDINIKENSSLYDWLSETKPYENKQPYKMIIEVLREAMADDILTKEEASNIIWLCEKYIKINPYYDQLTAGIQKLQGIIKGITFDNEINLAELTFLDNWMDENEHLKNTWPYDELYNLTTSVIQDKVITEEEHEQLLNFFKALSSNSENNKSPLPISAGFYQIDPQITFQEKTFCITGVSKKYKRKEIADRIELHGGYIQDYVSGKLDYLIVCDEKNSCWAFTCYGRKIEQAMFHRQQGKRLVIVHEFDLFDCFVD